MGRLIRSGRNRNFLGRAAVSLSYFAFFGVLSLALLTQAFAEETEERFDLDADMLAYDNASEIATAEGNVRLSGNDVEMFAGSAVYDAKSGSVTAYPNGTGSVTMTAGGVTLTGESVNYNVNTREGVVKQPSGKMDAIFFKGGDAVVMPADEAVRKGLISRAGVGKDGSVMTGFWTDASATTCDFDEPHYKFVSKKVTVILNKRVVLKKPRLYFGKRMVFQYPFDYIIPLNRGEKQSQINPWLTYDSDKGVGIGIGAPFVWASGQLDIRTLYWTDGITEADFNIRQSIGRDLTLFASSSRQYNKDDEDTMWRQQWGIMYDNPRGWTAMLRESQRELVETEMRPGMDRRYNVWRMPEFSFSSPWFKMAPYHFLKFGGIWGRYEDNADTVRPVVERIGGGARLYGEPGANGWTVKPFYGFEHWYFDYGRGDTSQKVTDMTVGFRWDAGRIKLGTAYVRRWADGSTPFFWDKYLDREDLYQQISFEFPGHEKWEKWEVSVRAGYDFVDNRLNEMIYSLSYNKHCMTWRLYVRDSRPNDEFSVGLRFIINAYPEKPLNIGEQAVYDPFERPVPDSDWSR